eukprot:TRINITY_DN25791_c0_g1_i1.p1 TRINITY_DN25791_c0_g1~~TRINITY_DN25791_c0_g1_i1.p1  ORF type:complete len:189 (+),score=7.07 TRINITY_DN25791_c0_g1_i1:211-777(+)
MQRLRVLVEAMANVSQFLDPLESRVCWDALACLSFDAGGTKNLEKSTLSRGVRLRCPVDFDPWHAHRLWEPLVEVSGGGSDQGSTLFSFEACADLAPVQLGRARAALGDCGRFPRAGILASQEVHPTAVGMRAQEVQLLVAAGFVNTTVPIRVLPDTRGELEVDSGGDPLVVVELLEGGSEFLTERSL